MFPAEITISRDSADAVSGASTNSHRPPESARACLSWPAKRTVTVSPGIARPQTGTAMSRWRTMWSPKIRGRTTSARTPAVDARSETTTARRTAVFMDERELGPVSIATILSFLLHGSVLMKGVRFSFAAASRRASFVETVSPRLTSSGRFVCRRCGHVRVLWHAQLRSGHRFLIGAFRHRHGRAHQASVRRRGRAAGVLRHPSGRAAPLHMQLRVSRRSKRLRH